MSWQLAALGVLGAALAAGFWWYERARPDARVIALVGTLAAFAALGRVAFAAVPNVKPTTDIVLIAGYALGAGPGFAVGALAGLTSNFFFGQGPWTPWQMAAWGATGLLGAALTRPTRGRIGRWPLALICGVAGFAFTAIQDTGDWVTYSDHSATQLGLYVGRGLAFDAIHAAGCVAFALALGPALISSVQRFARRLEVEWVTPTAVGALVLALTAAAGTTIPAPARAAGASPAAYLLAAQNADGGFGPARGQPSTPLYSGWAALGLASAGYRPAGVRRGRHSLLDYVLAPGGGSDTGSLERTLLVRAAAGLAPGPLGVALERRRRPDGSFAGQVNLTAFGLLALRAAGLGAPAPTVSWLAAQRNRDGGFGFAPGAPSDADDTGAVLEALAGTPARAARAGAAAYLRRVQDRDGGFAAAAGEGSNAQSTAWAIQGLDAAGVSVGALHRGGAPSPLAYLRSLIAPDGHVDYARGSAQTPVWVTAEALMALGAKPLPLAAVPAPAPVRAPSSAAGGHHRRHVGPAVRGRSRGRRPVRGRPGPAGMTPLSGLWAGVGFLTGLALAPLAG